MITRLEQHASRAIRYIMCTALIFGTMTFSAILSANESSLDSQISIERSESAQISNIDDWLIGVFSATDSINTIQYNWDWQCVFTSTGSYRVEVTSANGGSQLALESSSGEQMDYWIYSYVRRGNSYQLRGHTSSSFSLNNLSGSQSLTCADEPSNTNLWFAALVRPGPFNQASPGVYRDVVTLVVSPE